MNRKENNPGNKFVIRKYTMALLIRIHESNTKCVISESGIQMASCKQNEWEHGGSTNRKVDFFFDKSTNSTNEKMNEQLLFSDFYH